MYSWRITKYNPLHRNEDGSYIDDKEWTSFSEIGSKVDKYEYLETEQKYIDAIISFMEELGLKKAYISDFEGKRDVLKNIKQELNLEEIKKVATLTLREVIWCKLTFHSKLFVHFGYDYYMYIGAYKDCPKARMKVEKSGLFVETYNSPYLD
ncbi:hypothetical protein [Neobacillus sp. PS3-40]|uniref:hypothetical protein n=1 Tax=Neobacillus sp. PS3-40 TaxID=3070679 RepID=UPI0027DF0123|nr:hypothetical protein [Neobacillus sp. PS3-40]WML45444.1 hypothetical protein RCG20_05955 [Neobacillus sp. PS3-40]